MARPKKEMGISALKRIENAFWEMLEEMPYSEIMITSLCKRAKINHNTFYYHFHNMDDMATKMIEQNIIPDMPNRVLAALASGNLGIYEAVVDNKTQENFERACLIAGPHGASWMRDKLKAALLNLWIAALGLRLENIEKNEEVFLTFLIGGLLNVLGKYGKEGNLSALRFIVESDFGSGAISTLKNLSKKGLKM